MSSVNLQVLLSNYF